MSLMLLAPEIQETIVMEERSVSERALRSQAAAAWRKQVVMETRTA